MRVTNGGFDVAVIEQPLHKFQVACRAQNLGAEIVPEIMEPKADDAGALLDLPPRRAHPMISHRVAPAPHPAGDGTIGDEGEHMHRMVSLQGPKDLPDR